MPGLEDQSPLPSLRRAEADEFAPQELTPDTRREAFLRNVGTFGGKKIFVNLVVISFFLHYVRPQDVIPGFSVLKLPILFLVVTGIAWALKRSYGNWTPQIKIMLFFLVIEGLRGLVGKVFVDDFVINDAVMFHSWRDLLTIFTGIVFPIVAFFDRGPAVRRLIKTIVFSGLLLGAYVITHGGRGPGSFLGDENDVGCALLMLMAFSLAMVTEGGRSSGSKLLFVMGSILMFGGILATFSRGTFVGLVALAVIFLLRSRRKIVLIFVTSFVILLAIPFAPKGYLAEMSTIQQTDTGTADIRKHYWKLARRCFLDPRHTAFGVGLRNTLYWMNRYETVEDLRKYPSAAGRATHSIYFELLPDLGLWGVAVFGSLLFVSCMGNHRVRKRLQKIVLLARATERTVQSSLQIHDDKPIAAMEDENPQVHDQFDLIRKVRTEAQYLIAVATGTNVSMVGVLASGAFIDILYYPHVWILFGMSSLIAVYGKRIIFLSEGILSDIAPPPAPQPAMAGGF